MQLLNEGEDFGRQRSRGEGEEYGGCESEDGDGVASDDASIGAKADFWVVY